MEIYDNTGTCQTANGVRYLDADDNKAFIDALIAIKYHLLYLQDIADSTGKRLHKI
jgi:hypothetical protein